MLPNVAVWGKKLWAWVVSEPIFLLLVIGTLHLRIIPYLRSIDIDWSDLKREFDEFIASYRISRTWWFSSLIGALFATTIGASDDLVLTVLAFAIFAVPAIGYYFMYSPFGLRCTYIPLDEDQYEGENVCRPTSGTYTVMLKIEPGENIEDYQLDIHTPSGATVDRIDGETSHLDDDRQILYGVVQGDRDPYTEALYVEKTGSISPEGELVLIKSQGNNNTMEWIRLLPPK